LPVWGIIFLLGSWFIARTYRDTGELIKILSLFIGILVAFSLLQIGASKIQKIFVTEAIDKVESSPKFASQARDLPDVYYILLDAYESSWGLDKFFDFDNSKFVDYLDKRGFHTIENSLSNYSQTRFTLPALLNMDYLGNLISTDKLSNESVNHRKLIKDGLVFKNFRDMGYTYIHFGSQWIITEQNPLADININSGKVSEFSYILYKSTPLYPFNFQFEFFGRKYEQWNRVLNQFDELEKIPEMPEPTFTFVHIGIPHPPFIFDEDGSFIKDADTHTWEEEKYRYSTRDYVNQLVFLNKKLKVAIDRILSDSYVPPIIIIQSDHGSRIHAPPERKEDLNLSDDFDIEYVRGSLRNFSAYYLPNNGAAELYDAITQVNVFRLIFNQYYNAEYEYLEDKNYLCPRWDFYDLIDVTDIVKY
jgi:hypothetical protein